MTGQSPDLKPVLDVILDHTPDERGNMTIAALMPLGRMIALPANSN